MEEEDCRARLVAEKLLEEGLARVSEAAEIAEEHDVAAAAAIIAEEGVECVWVERGFTKWDSSIFVGDFILWAESGVC